MTDAVSFEAKLYAYRKDGKGIIVSFVVHPQEVPNALALADIGQRFGLALAQLREGAERLPDLPEPQKKAPDVDEGQRFPTKAPDAYRQDEAKARYAMAGEAEKAVTRAAILCEDPGFQTWITRKTHKMAIPQDGLVGNGKVAAFRLRQLLRISSRAKIGIEESAFNAFLALEIEYRAATGQFAEERG